MGIDQVNNNKSNTFANQIKSERLEEGKEKKSVQQSFSDALGTYTSFVKDRLKNGEPKFQIGGSEMTEKEWKNLIKKVDTSIDDIKDELAKRLEVLKEKAEKERVEKKKKEYKKILKEEEEHKEEEELLEKTIAELSRISLLQKASLERTKSFEEVESKEKVQENEYLNTHNVMEATEEQIKKLLEDR